MDGDLVRQATDLSFQKFFSSSMVRMAPRIRAERTWKPPSPKPQKALQKSVERPEKSTGFDLAKLDNEVDDGWRRADISSSLCRVQDSRSWLRGKGDYELGGCCAAGRLIRNSFSTSTRVSICSLT